MQPSGKRAFVLKNYERNAHTHTLGRVLLQRKTLAAAAAVFLASLTKKFKNTADSAQITAEKPFYI
jgi:hypothetical protein